MKDIDQTTADNFGKVMPYMDKHRVETIESEVTVYFIC
jgi:hypothetical protein